MNGAESLIRTLVAGGVETCFANPGTSEIHIVAALDRLPEMRCVLGLFEGVVTGAADGYARMAEKPACTLVHLGPGLANGLANLHNARRAQVPIINLVGQHATHHLHLDTPLTSDIEAIARPYSKWLRTSSASSGVGRDAAEAIIAARTAPGQIATLIVPADLAWSEGGAVAALPTLSAAPLPSAETDRNAAAMLRSGSKAAMLLTGNALYGKGLPTAGRIAAATGANSGSLSHHPPANAALECRRWIAFSMYSNRRSSSLRNSASLFWWAHRPRSGISLIRERTVLSLRRTVRFTRWRVAEKITSGALECARSSIVRSLRRMTPGGKGRAALDAERRDHIDGSRVGCGRTAPRELHCGG